MSIYDRWVTDQVRNGDIVEFFEEGSRGTLPGETCSASIGFWAAADILNATHQLRLPFKKPDDIAEADGVRIDGEVVSALGAAPAGDPPNPFEGPNQLFDVFGGNLLPI